MVVKEETYSIRITERELRDQKIKDGLVALVKRRLYIQKSKPYFIISKVEHQILKRHNSWVDVKMYRPKKKDQYKGEVGKYCGKRCVIRGGK